MQVITETAAMYSLTSDIYGDQEITVKQTWWEQVNVVTLNLLLALASIHLPGRYTVVCDLRPLRM